MTREPSEPPGPPDRATAGVKTPPDPQEAEWARRAQAGDLDAFNRIVERYQTLAYHIAARMVGDAAAEDVTQEAFFSAYRALGTLRGGSVRAWVLSIVVNRARDVLRTPHRRLGGSLDALMEQGRQEAHLTSPDPPPEARALQAETVRAVRAGWPTCRRTSG